MITIVCIKVTYPGVEAEYKHARKEKWDSQVGDRRQEWIERHVAVRYEKGWVIGVIKKRLHNARKTCKWYNKEPVLNFNVTCSADNSHPDLALAALNCVNLDSSLFGKVGVWALLSDKPLCSPSPAQWTDIRGPAIEKKKGRKLTRRLTPPPGCPIGPRPQVHQVSRGVEAT